MSKAEDLLNSLNSAWTATLTSNSSNEPHIVIGDDRYITVPDELKRLAVQYDHNIETVTFDCPRYWDEHDMSAMNVYINYLCPDKTTGIYKGENVRIDTVNSSIMHFDWTISRNVTLEKGNLVFLICVKNTDTDGVEKNHWNSELCKDCYISEGMEHDDSIVTDYISPDLIEQWYKEIVTGADAKIKKIADDLNARRESGEFDGISPTIEITDIQGGHRLKISDAEGTQTVDVMDTYIETSDAVAELLNRYIYVGDVKPTNAPALWFDTSYGKT